MFTTPRGLTEEPAAELVAAQMRAFGWDPQLDLVEPGRPNVVAVVEGDGPGPTLMFEGHTDVVTEGDPAGWTVDPFGAELADGRIWGRGSADMKSGVAAMLFAVDALQRAGSFPGRIVLGALVDEEGMMAGAKHFVASGRAAGVDAVICCEPEGGEICHVAKGALRLRIDLAGKMAHGAMPFQGRNPNRAAGHVLVALAELEARVQAVHGEHPYLGRVWITPTVLRSGEPAQMNVMPADASAWVDVRTVPAVDHAALVEQVRELVASTAAEHGIDGRLTVVDDRPAVATPEDHGLVRSVWAAHTLHGDGLPRLGGVPGATDGTVLTSRTGMASVVYGPGGKWIAHQADEFVEVDDIVAPRAGVRRRGPPVPQRRGLSSMPQPALRRGARNDITDVAGIAVGHHHRIGRGWLTGTTVLVAPDGSVGGVDVRGGGPGTRETDCLAPTTMVSRVDAVCLSGGSAYGLDAAGGVVRWLEERHRGFQVGPDPGHVVPIVPAAVLFDLGRGAFANRPDASFGARAVTAARPRAVAQGTVGAGAGARSSRLKGGIGSASVVLPSGITVAALVALNSSGSAIDLATGLPWGADRGIGDEFADLRRRPSRAELRAHLELPLIPPPANTTLAVVATDAILDKPECTRLAVAAHDGMARAIDPIHTYGDGDVAFTIAHRAREVPLDAPPVRIATARYPSLSAVIAAAADVVARAVVHAVLHATSAGGMLSYRDQFPSAFR